MAHERSTCSFIDISDPRPSLTMRSRNSQGPSMVKSTSPWYTPGSPLERRGTSTVMPSAIRPVSITCAPPTGFPASTSRAV